MDPCTAGGLVTTIGSMAAATKSIIETIKAAKGKAKNEDVEKALSEAVEQIYSLQSSVLDAKEKALDLKAETLSLHTENLKLREENSQFRGQIAQLREDIRCEQEGTVERKKYQEQKINGAVVLVHEDDPDTYYCPNCFKTKRQAFPLQAVGYAFSFAGTHECGVCHTMFGAR